MTDASFPAVTLKSPLAVEARAGQNRDEALRPGCVPYGVTQPIRD